MTCGNCLRQFDHINEEHYSVAWHPPPSEHLTIRVNGTPICSLACLTEWVWELREAQPKLSKSRGEVSDG